MYGICFHGNEHQFCDLCCISTAMPILAENMTGPLSPAKKGLVCACGCGKAATIHGRSSSKDGVVYYFATAMCQANWVTENR